MGSRAKSGSGYWRGWGWRADRRDYEWARDLLLEKRLGEKCGLLLSPVHGELEGHELARWVLEDHLDVRLQLALHKELFGVDKRGV